MRPCYVSVLIAFSAGLLFCRPVFADSESWRLARALDLPKGFMKF